MTLQNDSRTAKTVRLIQRQMPNPYEGCQRVSLDLVELITWSG